MQDDKPAGRNDGHLMDYSQITDRIYVGSNLCEGGVCPIHGPEFEKLEIKVELNLDNERKEIPPDHMESYTWLPVVDGHAPTQVQLDIGSSIVASAVEDGKTVYIHCKNGHGRGPTMAAAYLIRYKKMSLEEAQNFIKTKRPEIHIEDVQRRALTEFKERWSM